MLVGSRMALDEGASAGHRPLFLMSVLQHFRDVQVGPKPAYPRINGTYVDCTFGRGGHSRALLRDLTESSTLYALDVDRQAINVAKRLARRDPRLKVQKASFARLRAVLGDVRVLASEVSCQHLVLRRHLASVSFEVCAVLISARMTEPWPYRMFRRPSVDMRRSGATASSNYRLNRLNRLCLQGARRPHQRWLHHRLEAGCYAGALVLSRRRPWTFDGAGISLVWVSVVYFLRFQVSVLSQVLP